jgi:hypothetical protein
MKNKRLNRDLLVLFKQEFKSPQAIEFEVEWLHDLLFDVEQVDNFVLAHEIIHLNRLKVLQTSFEIKKLLRNRKEQPFVFLSCKN